MTTPEGTERDESREAGDLDLTDEQADSVKGGVTSSDITITKHVDKPTPGN
jgi:hypothetical protein